MNNKSGPDEIRMKFFKENNHELMQYLIFLINSSLEKGSVRVYFKNCYSGFY